MSLRLQMFVPGGRPTLLLFGFYEFHLRLLGDAWLEAAPAAGFVHVGGAYYDQVVRSPQTLRVLGGVPAPHTDRQRLGDRFGVRQQVGDGREGPAQVVGIQPGNDHLLAAVRQALRHLH